MIMVDGEEDSDRNEFNLDLKQRVIKKNLKKIEFASSL